MMLLTSLLEKKSLGTKLFLAVSYGIVIMLLVGFNAISNIRTLSNENTIIYENYLQCVSHLKEANIHLVRIHENIAQLTQIEATRYNQAKSNITKSTVMLQEEIAVARSSLSSPEDKKLLTNFDTFFNDYLGNIKQAILLSGSNKENKSTENALERFITDNDFLTTANTAEELLSTLSHNKEQQAFFISEKLKKMREESEHISLLLMFFGVLITAISGWLVGKSVTEPINRLQTSIEGLAAGNLDVVIPHVNDRNEIGAIARASAVLQTMCRGMETQRWIKDNFAAISTDLYQVENFPDFAQKFLSAICPLINAGYGVFYIYTQDELQLLSSYGEHEHSEHKSRIALGEGLVGQCALEKKLINITNLPEDYIKIRSSLGESTPKNIVVYPILRVNVLVGVLEIAFFTPFSKSEKLLLSALMPMVAMSMDILDRNLKTQELLRETKHQADRMEIQAAKLEEQAVELEAQQSELKETEEWFRGIIESAPDAMLVIDAEGTIVLCNKRADEVFGYPPGELIWGNVDNLVPESMRLDHPAMRKLFMEEGGARMMGAKSDLYGVRKDGTLFPIEVGLSKLPSAHNQSFVCVSARDITLKKEADVALHHAKKIAEDTTQMKSDFLANMSHEIRTPMNAILGISHLISKTHLTHKQRDYVKKIQGSSQHLLGIINDILDLSKIESGKILIEQVDFKIEKVLTNLVNLISDKAKDKGLSLVFDIDDNLPEYLNGDPLRLGQILINYANNAVKFTEKGEIIITVKVLEESDDELFLHFSVRDTGIGLSSDAIEKLFQSFQQADSSTSRKYGGSGLGLSISKQLATLMNGEVGVESELGKGSLFWFTARLKKAVKKARNTTSHVNSLKGRRVLVVDDNEIARYELENMLSNIGLSVTQVSKGTTALKYIRMAEKVGEPYEIIFLDWYMPEMDGAETAKAIHALNLKFQPHLVMVTAHGREEVLKEMEVAGLEDVFIKPVNASLLFDSVMRLLSNSHDHHVDTEKEAVDDYDLSNLINELKIIYGTSILVVEDNELNQEVALGLLSDEGFHVDIANDGKEAIYMINNKYYDIVLMDMQMPVMDGVSATIEIRKDPKFTHLPIVAMTANAMPQDKENCKNAGMNDYISKPIDPEELFRALLKWIRPTLKEELKELKNDFSISEPLPINDLPIIEGLDMQLGMQRVLGKKTLYLNMLKNYVRGQESVPASLVDALNNSDFEAAQRLAHTAKSVNGNIGAMSLHDIAAHIETMIAQQASREEINEALVHFEILQTQMIEALKSALSTPQREEIPQHWEVEDINATVNQLNMLLQDDDMAALTFLNEHSALLTFALGVEVFTNLAHLVRNVDFEQACALIEQVKQSV